MKTILLVIFLSCGLLGSEAAEKIDKGKEVTDSTSNELEKVNKKNEELSILDKEKNVKILNLEFIQQKINEQNAI